MTSNEKSEESNFQARSSLFASPAVKPKRFANVSVLNQIKHANQVEEDEEEPMEIDVSTHEPKEAKIPVENSHSTSTIITTTPRRKSIPTAGRRRSIIFDRQEILKEDLIKPASAPEIEKESQSVSSTQVPIAISNDSTIFELIAAEDHLSSDDPITNLPKEHHALTEYKKQLEAEIYGYHQVIKRHEKKLNNALERVEAPYVTQWRNFRGQTNEENLFDAFTEKRPIDILMSAVDKFKKLTTNTKTNSKLQEKVDSELEKKFNLEKKLALLKSVEEKYKITEEAKKRKEKQRHFALENIRKAREAIDAADALLPIVVQQMRSL